MRRRTHERLLAAAVEAAARGAAHPEQKPAKRQRTLAAVGTAVGVVLGVVATLVAGPVAAAWDQRDDPSGSIATLDGRPVTESFSGNIHTLGVREDAHSHAGTFFLVIHPVGDGSNGELYPRRLPQQTDTVSACADAPDLRCTTVNLGEEGNRPSTFRLTLYFVSDENFGSFDDVAATFAPFPKRELPAPADEIATVVLTRSS